jgi:xylulokinase
MILAADLGSTNFKAAVFADDGSRLADAARPLPYAIRTHDRSELDPDAVTETFFAVLDDALSRAGAARKDLLAISITSQAQTFCICDPEGRAVSPMFGWTDARAHSEAEDLQALLGPAFHATTGFPAVSPLLTLAKVLWWKRRHGLDRRLRIMQLPSWLAMHLGAPHATDHNLAAMSGLYSIPAGTWWAAALDAIGVDSSQLGTLVEPGQRVATSASTRPHGFADHLEVVFAGNDHTAGALGCGCGAGRSILTLGTAGVLYRHAGESPGPYSSNGLWGPFPGGAYYELLCLDHACSALDWADEFLFGSVDSPQFVEQAGAALVTERSPRFDPLKWGTPCAWSGDGTPQEKAYAVLEGIAIALHEMAGDSFCREGGEIVILGGGSRLDFWVQLVADIFQRRLIRVQDDGLDGAAMLAGIPVKTTPATTTTFEPIIKHAKRFI